MKYTKESLQNTWGVVESKEHAEFIIELAELHGFDVGGYDEKDNFFYTDDDYIGFTPTSWLASNHNEKQITIPLPPKAKEWPQVGDEVSTSIGSGFVMMMPDKHGNFVVDIKGFHHLITIDWMVKPKSKQDLLIEDLQTKLCNNNYVDNFTLASDIINGMIPGLSYNSDIESAVKVVINKHLDGDD